MMKADIEGTSASAATAASDSSATVESMSQHGDGPKIQIILKADALKPYAHAFLIVMVFNVLLSGAALFMCMAVAPALVAKSEFMAEKLANANRNEVQMYYWASQVYAVVSASGVKIPPPPKQKE